MLDKMKPYRLSIVLALLIGYLGVQALTGERGLLSGGERDALLRRPVVRKEHLTHASFAEALADLVTVVHDRPLREGRQTCSVCVGHQRDDPLGASVSDPVRSRNPRISRPRDRGSCDELATSSTRALT